MEINENMISDSGSQLDEAEGPKQGRFNKLSLSRKRNRPAILKRRGFTSGSGS